MATTANPPPGATPANGANDPFVSTPAQSHGGALRYAQFDADQFASYSTSSPSQAKRALEAHLKDTDRRIQDASRLGTTLLQQRKDLSARLKDVEQVQQDNEVPSELRKKLADLEKEYNEIGRESARAFLPKSRTISSGGDITLTPSSTLTGTGAQSPTKAAAPSRKQRNQPSSRVHDIEFATEISTQLLAQVRQLQGALAEKDDALKDATSMRAQLEADAVGMRQRMKHMDENEQRYKDENWNLETKLQDLEASFKGSTDKEQRLAAVLKATESEKSSAQRDLDDLKASHDKLSEEHAIVKRQQEGDLNMLRRDAATHDTEKQKLQKKIEELTSQNTELARGLSYRWNQPSAATDTEFATADEDQHTSDGTPDESAPASPVKGTPRHGMLESETLKSSLNHAHRMIQNLKNNIHREKTEKLELKRMLQDARDEIESRRNDNGVGANVAKKRRSENDSIKFKKPQRPLGANRSSTTEILEDEPDWEEYDGARTPSKSRFVSGSMPGGFATTDTDTTDAFETANERDGTTTDAFETGRESVAGDDSDELTETESTMARIGTVKGVSPLVGAKARDRRSFQSTASTEDDEPDVRTPVQAAQPKYRLRMQNRDSKRSLRVGELSNESPMQSHHSPSSSVGTPMQPGQSLGDELDAMDDDSIEGTPSSQRLSESVAATPDTQRQASPGPETPTRDVPVDAAALEEPEIGSPVVADDTASPSAEHDNLAHQANSAMLAHESATHKPTYADAGVMTEPWEPEASKPGLRERAEGAIGGALAGFGLGALRRGQKEDEREADKSDEVSAGASRSGSDVVDERPPTALANSAPGQVEETPAQVLSHSDIMSQETVPITPPQKQPAALGFSNTASEDIKPETAEPDVAQMPATPLLPRRSSRRLDDMYIEDEFAKPGMTDSGTDALPGTENARPGAGFFGAMALAPPQQHDVDATTPMSTTMMPDPLQIKKPMSDEGSQTVVSGDDIDKMLRNKTRASAVPSLASSPSRPNTAIGPGGRRSIDGTPLGAAAATGAAVIGGLFASDGLQNKQPRRPASSGSMRNKVVAPPPPLPEEATQKIAAAGGGKAPVTPAPATAGAMGPPMMPASAYKQKRPLTPADSSKVSSTDGPTPRAHRASHSSTVASPSKLSRRTSVSSFASECDERFGIQASNLMYPDDVPPTTDPRMIQAITQTMIGEYLWKYTRKAGRSETSSSRHRRFFWVHPYTRTLYWSEKDPSTAGRDMLKAKSVAIETVRVITDENTYPPGLHRKSIVVVTPGREIVFTAPTGQRHETWFNALSYLLLRTEQEKLEAEDTFTQEDVEEFNPGGGQGLGSTFRRSISRMTGGTAGGRSQSRLSLSSYNSRTTRNSSPSRHRGAAGNSNSLAARQSAAAARAGTGAPTLTPNAAQTQHTGTATSRTSGRLSSFSSRFRPGSAARGSMTSSRGSYTHNAGRTSLQGPEAIYDASVAADSAEDVRGQMERQRERAAELENVRACCDGKHDVGSLHRHGHGGGGGRQSSFRGRFSAGGQQAHGHAGSTSHAHPKAEPMGGSMRPRRGE